MDKKKTCRRILWGIFWAVAILPLLLLLFALLLVADESVSVRNVETYPYPGQDEQNLSELYETVYSLCEQDLARHELTDISGSFHREDDAIRYEQVTFTFERYLRDGSEGGRISVIMAAVTLDDAPILKLTERVGPGKAFSGTGLALLTEPQAISRAEQILLELSKKEPEKTGFTIWRTLSEYEETGGLGDPAVRVYIPS